ncbi:uncharacterized protein LOC125573834 [Nematostella vectensis]|uniref:uncharacterized protein LOC125573834 n=1 Tax=Nematostella vectensis TaxID=45351 RepID=UPI00207784FD|nr:uncharacterized protein LOC125573834 [Nematostella vectensis]
MICNLRSLAPKVEELECVMEHNGVDIACITETWLSDEISDSQVSLKDFTLFRKDRPSHAGGIATYIRSVIPCVRLSEAELSGAVSETMWIHVKPFRLPRSVSTILIGVIYHPPHASAEDNNMLYSHVQETVDRFLRSHPEALVCVTGDFNPTSTKISPVPFKRSAGLTQTVNVLTRDTGTLDWCLTNNPKCLQVPKQLPKIGRSDHYGVLIQQAPPSQKGVKCTITKRDTRDSALRGFGSWITSFSWDEVYCLDNCKEKFELFYQILSDAINQFLPLKTFRVHSTDKPWISTKTKSFVARRQHALVRYGKDSPAFKMWRNKVQKAISSAKKSFYNSKVKNLKESSVGKWWKEIKNLSGVSDDSGQWYLQLVDGLIIDSVDSLCDKINDFFTCSQRHGKQN